LSLKKHEGITAYTQKRGFSAEMKVCAFKVVYRLLKFSASIAPPDGKRKHVMC